MIVIRSERFDRCLEELRQGGGETAIAVRRAELLIEEFANGSSSRLEQRWKTNNGEARIDGCRKFYIGRRYRLVCIKQGQQALLLYAGTHDDCDRWLERNRGTSFHLEPSAAATPSVPEPAAAVYESTDVPDEAETEDLVEVPSQKELRLLFRGLCG